MPRAPMAYQPTYATAATKVHKCTLIVKLWASCGHMHTGTPGQIAQCDRCILTGRNARCERLNFYPSPYHFKRKEGHVEIYPDGTHTGYCWMCRMDPNNKGKAMWNECKWVKEPLTWDIVNKKLDGIEKLR